MDLAQLTEREAQLYDAQVDEHREWLRHTDRNLYTNYVAWNEAFDSFVRIFKAFVDDFGLIRASEIMGEALRSFDGEV